MYLARPGATIYQSWSNGPFRALDIAPLLPGRASGAFCWLRGGQSDQAVVGIHHGDLPYRQAQGRSRPRRVPHKRVILEIYDEMQQAIESGEPYQTLLDPPPADPRVAHPARETEDDRS
jgi:hypothetical protein